MFNKIISAIIHGVEVHRIDVEVDISEGLPVMDMVGLLGSEIKESKERVRTGLKNMGVFMPPKRITVSLTPADIRKSGSGFDLPIAVGVLISLGRIKSIYNMDETMIAGELSLDGTVKEIKGVLSIVSYARDNGYRQIIIPVKNGQEGAVIEGIDVIGVSSLREVTDILNGIKESKLEKTNIEELYYKKENKIDISDIKGQEQLKRALLISAAGKHNILLAGPPGSGKSMAAERLNSILPSPDIEEAIEITKIYSIAGLLNGRAFMFERPVRKPHHSTTEKAMIGGGIKGRPGEITLAHKGILFLDEFGEFKRETMEVLRQPLEQKKICISRTTGTYEFPADFIFVGATNMCRCGYYPDKKKCRCSSWEVDRYLNKISGPFLDRMDICVNSISVNVEDMQKKKIERSSEDIKNIVRAAWMIQNNRYKNTDIKYNSELNAGNINKYAYLGEKEKNYIKNVYDKLDISGRGYHKTLKVARTIADLEGSLNITTKHIAEAIGYRASFTRR